MKPNVVSGGVSAELSKKPVEERSGPKTEEVVQPRIEQEPTIQAWRLPPRKRLTTEEKVKASPPPPVGTKPEVTTGQKAYKKRPSKRSGGYDDFSAFPPTPWTPQDCPNLTVKPRRRGGPSVSEDVREEPIATQAPLSSATASLSDFCIEGGSAVERYGKLLASLRKIDTFLASDLEQNSHAVRFDSEQVTGDLRRN